jgi:hypothetical protein
MRTKSCRARRSIPKFPAERFYKSGLTPVNPRATQRDAGRPHKHPASAGSRQSTAQQVTVHRSFRRATAWMYDCASGLSGSFTAT